MHRRLALLLLLLTVASTSVAALARQDDAPARPRILVTNDDGIGSPGLTTLVLALAELGDVYVSAPDGNRSGASQSTTVLGEPFTTKTVDVPGSVHAIAISATPADAALVGILQFGAEAPFDLVVSGINQGSNVGDASHLSGTVGAAMEGARLGVPAIAVSQGAGREFELSASFTARFARRLLEEAAAAGTVWSINVPSSERERIRGVAVCSMGGSPYRWTALVDGPATSEGAPTRRVQITRADEVPAGTDTEAFLAGDITITPLRFDWTDEDALDAASGWKLSVD